MYMHTNIEGQRVRVSARETESERNSRKNWGRQLGISSRKGRGAAIAGELSEVTATLRFSEARATLRFSNSEVLSLGAP